MDSLEKLPDRNATPPIRGQNVFTGMVLTNLLLLGLVLALLADIYVRLLPEHPTMQSHDFKKNQDFPPPFQSQAPDAKIQNAPAAQQRANQDPSNRRKKLIDDRIAPSP